jgi:hypothetical protein
VDLTKAYDSVPRDRLWTVLLNELNIDITLVKALKLMYCNLRAEVITNAKLKFDHIAISIGLKQGCPSSPGMFGTYFDRIKHKIELILKQSSQRRYVQDLV